MYTGYIGLTPNGISIHALVKRATIFRPINKMFQVISIHALVKRATTGSLKLS